VVNTEPLPGSLSAFIKPYCRSANCKLCIRYRCC